MNKLFSLANLFDESLFSFIKEAGDYDLFRAKIEQAARKNKKPFRHWFTEGDRIYLDYSPAAELNDEDKEVVSFLEDKGYSVDYLGGYAEKDGRKMRIGKILQSIDDEGYLSIFNNSKARTAIKKQLKIAISQDIHDIGSMSTDRGWNSCMNLKGGANADSVYCEVASGGLIAYLIEADDLEIKRPLARVLIRRYSNRSGKSYAIPEEQIYGSAPGDFLKKIQDWLDERQGYTTGEYKLRGGWYTDSLDEEIYPKPKSWQREAEELLKKDKSFSAVLLDKILNNRHEFSDKIYQKAEEQIFKDLKFAYSLLSGIPFKIKNYKFIFADYLSQNLEKIKELLGFGSNVTLKYFAKDIKSQYPTVSSIINEHLLLNAEKTLSDFYTGELDNFKANKIYAYEALDSLYLKLDMASPNKLFDTIKDALNYSENNLGLEFTLRLINHITHVLYINDFINIRTIDLIKPYLIKLFEGDAWSAYYDNKYFLNRCGSLVSFLVPYLRNLLSSTTKAGYPAFEEGTLKRKELLAVIEAIENNVPVDFVKLEQEFNKEQRLNR